MAVSSMTSWPSRMLMSFMLWNANLTQFSSLLTSGSPVTSIAPLLGLLRELHLSPKHSSSVSCCFLYQIFGCRYFGFPICERGAVGVEVGVTVVWRDRLGGM